MLLLLLFSVCAAQCSHICLPSFSFSLCDKFYRKLTKYIRLADYYMIYTLVGLCQDKTIDVLNFIERKSNAPAKASTYICMP